FQAEDGIRVLIVTGVQTCALPIFNGFVGEFLILLGAFQVNRWLAAAASQRLTWNAPRRIRNSPTKPLSPGSPSDESATTRKTAENAGITFHRPPKSAMSRVWRRS